MKNKKKLMLMLMIIIIIINILIFILLQLYKNENKSAEDLYLSTSEKTETTSYSYDGKLYPENNYEFEQKYIGQKDFVDIYKAIYNFVSNTYNLYSKTIELNEKEEFSQYYAKNKNDLKYKYMVNNEEDFTNLVNKLREIYKNNTNQYKTVKFISDTYKADSENFECNLLIVFNDSKNLKVKIIVPNGNKSIYFSTIED